MAQFKDARTPDVICGLKFIFIITGYAGGESVAQIVKSLPSPRMDKLSDAFEYNG